jgi:hypothetical protein
MTSGGRASSTRPPSRLRPTARSAGRRPASTLPKLQAEAETTIEELRSRVGQHHIDYAALSADDFDAYFDARRRRLLDLIGRAMGKAVAETATPSVPEDYDLDEEEPSDDDIAEAVA